MLLPEATRAWREGVPTVIVMETGYHLDNTSKAFREGIPSHLETFADYPDLKDRYFKLGDMRYGLTRMHMCVSMPCYLRMSLPIPPGIFLPYIDARLSTSCLNVHATLP